MVLSCYVRQAGQGWMVASYFSSNPNFLTIR